MPNLRLIRALITYLKQEKEHPDACPDTKESLDVAVQCLQTAYDIDPREKVTDAVPFSIEEIFQSACSSIGSESQAEKMRKAEMLKNLGNNLMKSNQFVDAVKYYSDAIELDNHNAIYYGNRAAAYSKLNDFHNAVVDCIRAIEIDPKYAKAYGRMGLAYASLDQHDDAIKAFKKAAELDPTNESYQSNLKIAIEKRDRPSTANLVAGLPGLHCVDWQTLFTNPAFRNMAVTLMQDPNILNALSTTMANPNATPGGSGESSTTGPLTDNPRDVLFEVGQYLAAQMQAANPDFVEQFRQTTSRAFNRHNQDNRDSSTQ